MKCPNCGYNCEDKYCAICGTKLPEQPLYTSPNPYESAHNGANNFQGENSNYPNNANFNTNFNNADPCNQPNAPVNNNTNSSQNDFHGGYPNIPQGGMPVPPAYPNVPKYTDEPKKKSKTLPVVLTALIVFVIVAGAVISVYSACTYNKSIITDFFNNDELYDNYDDSNYYDDNYPSEYIDDSTTHKIGEAKELPDCKVTLKRVEKDDKSDKSKAGKSRTSYVFEIENTTDKYIALTYVYCDATDTDSDTSLDWLSSNTSTDEYNSDYIGLDPNQKKEISFDYSVPNNTESIELYLSFTGDNDKYEYSGTFAAE